MMEELMLLRISINSSKVYCKSYKRGKNWQGTLVLIVAKCIVNYDFPAMG